MGPTAAAVIARILKKTGDIMGDPSITAAGMNKIRVKTLVCFITYLTRELSCTGPRSFKMTPRHRYSPFFKEITKKKSRQGAAEK